MGATVVTTTETRVRPAAGSGCTGNDPLEAAAVRAGWRLVDAYERLSPSEAGEVFGPEVTALMRHAQATVPNLEPWQGVPNLRVYQSDSNRLRFRRTLDFIREGESVFDIGFGKGYLCGLLLRDRHVKAYHGIDVVPGYIDSVARMLEANGFTGDNVHVSIGDLYELDQADVATSGATVMVCCEVLEHLPEPDKALATLADALPDGAELIFSVPLYGRLEGVWGHRTVYDAARLRSMCEAAGLFVHHVEPLSNTWTLVVASRTPEPSPRVRLAAGASVEVPIASQVEEYDFVPVKRSEMGPGRWVGGADCQVSPAPHGDVRCDATGHDPKTAASGRFFRKTTESQGQYAGVAFTVPDLVALRVRLGLEDDAPVKHVYVDLHDGEDRVARWHWQPPTRQLTAGKTRRWAFRPGLDTAPFTYTDAGVQSASINRVEVFVELVSGQETSFTVCAAYLPRSSTAR